MKYKKINFEALFFFSLNDWLKTYMATIVE